MSGKILKSLLFFAMALVFKDISAQSQLPMGIPYQAVARDNFGKELASRQINVRFSIISENPGGPLVYQELHSNVLTSKFGVFSLTIGYGSNTGGSVTDFSQIGWSEAFHFLNVEVKFESNFIDMGTMQFLAVPYALYAQKSLEPGPVGPKGDPGAQGIPGDPASDDQTLSFDGSILSISGGNSLTLNDLIQNLTVINQADGTYLGISRGNSVKLATIEADGDPTNEIQDIVITSDKLKITRNPLATEWDMTRYLDNTDAQSLKWDPVKRRIGITGDTITVGLSELKNDADADPTNEIQDLQLTGNNLTITGKTGATAINLGTYLDNTDNQSLTYSESNHTLTIDRGNSVTLGSMVAFRSKKSTSEVAPITSSVVMTFNTSTDYNIGNCFNGETGIFTAPFDGLYTFNISYLADGLGDGREISIYVNSVLYEKLAINIASGSTIPVRSVTMRLSSNNSVSIVVNTGLATQTGTGTFSGYRVY